MSLIYSKSFFFSFSIEMTRTMPVAVGRDAGIEDVVLAFEPRDDTVLA